MQVWSVANQKGGVGKTTTAVNLAAGLALLGKRTLLVDLDPQANATFAALGNQDYSPNSYHLLADRTRLAEAVRPGRIPNLSVVPSDIDLAGAEVELISAIGGQTILAGKVEAVAGQFDYVVVDTPPSLGLLTINALSASDRVLVPVSASVFALKGIGRLTDTIEKVRSRLGRPELEIGGVLVTLWERTNVARDTLGLLREHFGSRICETVVPKNIRLEEAHSRHLSIFEYDDESAGANAYRRLVEEVVARGQKDRSARGGRALRTAEAAKARD
ncbi:MAG: ParA family protein [Chloroflexi bacterium]|nr:ParA family protein [Chloroflexota bacterium]